MGAWAWCKVQMKYDAMTGQSRGFCFVTFGDETSAIVCLDFKDHTISGKWVALSSVVVVAGQHGVT